MSVVEEILRLKDEMTPGLHRVSTSLKEVSAEMTKAQKEAKWLSDRGLSGIDTAGKSAASGGIADAEKGLIKLARAAGAGGAAEKLENVTGALGAMGIGAGVATLSVGALIGTFYESSRVLTSFAGWLTDIIVNLKDVDAQARKLGTVDPINPDALKHADHLSRNLEKIGLVGDRIFARIGEYWAGTVDKLSGSFLTLITRIDAAYAAMQKIDILGINAGTNTSYQSGFGAGTSTPEEQGFAATVLGQDAFKGGMDLNHAQRGKLAAAAASTAGRSGSSAGRTDFGPSLELTSIAAGMGDFTSGLNDIEVALAGVQIQSFAEDLSHLGDSVMAVAADTRTSTAAMDKYAANQSRLQTGISVGTSAAGGDIGGAIGAINPIAGAVTSFAQQLGEQGPRVMADNIEAGVKALLEGLIAAFPQLLVMLVTELPKILVMAWLNAWKELWIIIRDFFKNLFHIGGDGHRKADRQARHYTDTTGSLNRPQHNSAGRGGSQGRGSDGEVHLHVHGHVVGADAAKDLARLLKTHIGTRGTGLSVTP